jgi:hypothetical protein
MHALMQMRMLTPPHAHSYHLYDSPPSCSVKLVALQALFAYGWMRMPFAQHLLFI